MADTHHHANDVNDVADVLSGSRVKVKVQHHDRAVIAHVTGEIDLLTAPQVEEAVLPLVQEQPSVLVIDLSGVSFLASAGLKLLVAAQQGSRGTRIRVVANDQHTFRPIEMTGLSEQLAVYPTVADALQTD